MLAFEVGLDPPVLLLATIQALDRLALARQVVELSALGRLADLTLHPGFVWHQENSCRARLLHMWHAEQRGCVEHRADCADRPGTGSDHLRCALGSSAQQEASGRDAGSAA